MIFCVTHQRNPKGFSHAIWSSEGQYLHRLKANPFVVVRARSPARTYESALKHDDMRGNPRSIR